MSKNTHEQQKRRLIILKGISQDLKHSEIATQLGVNRWVIEKDLNLMRRNGDPGLKQALKTREQNRTYKQSEGIRKLKKRFLRLTGMTFKEKSFRNMIDYYKPELMEIIKSKDQNAAINSLPKSVRKSLKRNEIITNRWHDREITQQAIDYLS